ncbi:MAG TPA: hypothetical protein VFY23_12300, partial [Candidatus Limnocylindrales bacterium]|nr:hypothetical protein [Candidatus Limnocylindrales bacterium]
MSPTAPAPKASTDGKTRGRGADAPRLSDDQVGEVLRLLRGADSIELKATVPVDDHRAAIQGLPMDPVESQPRQVWFFDTPDLALSKAGVVVRARRRQGGAGDTVVKLRPVEPADLPASLRRQADFNVEVDVLPGGFVCSASLKGRAPGADVRAAGRGELPLKRLLSKTQREFYTAHAPAGLRLSDLVPLGPTFLLKATFDVTLSRRQVQSMVAEMWFYPDGSRILELSTKCPPPDAFAIGAETRAYLTAQGVPLAAVQETKTRTALEYYARMLAASADGEASAEG